MYNVLVLGSGNNCTRQVCKAEREFDFSDSKLTKIDMDTNCGADIVMDMDGVGTTHALPFSDNEFDEIHAYNCLEHWGRQGDWKGFFNEFKEYHRVLKVGGEFICLVPINSDAVADPGHTRFFSLNHFGFLNQNFYKDNLDKGTCVTDYRWYWKDNFELEFVNTSSSHIAVRMVKT